MTPAEWKALQKEHWYLMLSTVRVLPPAEWQAEFDAFFEDDYGKPVRESAEKARKRAAFKDVTGKDSDQTPDIADVWLQHCADEPGALVELCALKASREFLNSRRGMNFLVRLGKRIERRTNDKRSREERKRAEWNEVKTDNLLIYFWTLCFPGRNWTMPPLAFFTDKALAKYFDFMVEGLRCEKTDPMTVRAWRKRWGLKRPDFFLIRDIGIEGDYFRLIWAHLPKCQNGS